MHRIASDIDVHKLAQAVMLIDDVMGRAISQHASDKLRIARKLIVNATDEAIIIHADCGNNKDGAGI